MAISNPLNVPQDQDKGTTFWDDLEDAVTRINDHTHNGINSEKINIKDLLKTDMNFYQDLAVSIVGPGQQDFTLSPAKPDVDLRTSLIQLRDNANNYEVFEGIKIQTISATQVRLISEVSIAGTYRLVVRG